MKKKGPFRHGQLVVNLDTGFPAVVLRFKGRGLVEVRSQATGRVFTKNYYYLEDYVEYNTRMQQ
jgi:hypothetical protein